MGFLRYAAFFIYTAMPCLIEHPPVYPWSGTSKQVKNLLFPAWDKFGNNKKRQFWGYALPR
jgi:hypothetical protein